MQAIILRKNLTLIVDTSSEVSDLRDRIDLFKVIDAILPGVQNYWGERAAKPEIANGGVE